MTDEGARRTVKEALKVDDDYGYMSMEVVLVKAGYRAGLEEAQAEWSRLDDTVMSYESVWDKIGSWLDEKVKEQP